MSVEVNILGPKLGRATLRLRCNSGTISTLVKKLSEQFPQLVEEINRNGTRDYINVYLIQRVPNNWKFSLSRLVNSYEKVVDSNDEVYIIFPIELEGKYYAIDVEGYLEDWTEWNEGLAIHMAELDEVELNEDHWGVLNFLREYYTKYQIAPMIKVLTKEVGKRFGADKGNTKYLYEHFPAGPAKQACRYAGLPKPTG